MNSEHYTLELLQTTPRIVARAQFPASFQGFDGHFPGNPVLPGFMHVQVALDALKSARVTLDLHAVTQAKFVHPILPDQQVQVVLDSNEDGSYAAELSVSGKKCSSFVLQVG